jgi:Fe-S-cluster containining protein
VWYLFAIIFVKTKTQICHLFRPLVCRSETMSQIEQMIYRISTTSRTLHIAQIHWHNWYYLSEYMIRYGLLKGRAFMSINVKEYRRVNHIGTIQRNWQHLEHKTKTNKVKIQICHLFRPLVCRSDNFLFTLLVFLCG